MQMKIICITQYGLSTANINFLSPWTSKKIILKKSFSGLCGVGSAKIVPQKISNSALWFMKWSETPSLNHSILLQTWPQTGGWQGQSVNKLSNPIRWPGWCINRMYIQDKKQKHNWNYDSLFWWLKQRERIIHRLLMKDTVIILYAKIYIYICYKFRNIMRHSTLVLSLVIFNLAESL